MSIGRDGGWVTARDLAFLILRLALGVIFIAHGGQKLFGWFEGPGPEKVVENFGKMGFPAFLAWAAILTEFFGGVLVILGLFTRVAGLGLAVTMLVAALKVHGQHGFFLASNGFEFNLALGAMGLFLALAGPGAWALGGDTERRLISGRGRGDRESAAAPDLRP